MRCAALQPPRPQLKPLDEHVRLIEMNLSQCAYLLPVNIQITRTKTAAVKTYALMAWTFFIQAMSADWPAGPVTVMNGRPM